uniref:Uncharacterized protein n=1 Tax=Rhizochromulina marina TaxID=1034831 RepID=A0A7S2RAT7_9STRA
MAGIRGGMWSTGRRQLSSVAGATPSTSMKRLEREVRQLSAFLRGMAGQQEGIVDVVLGPVKASSEAGRLRLEKAISVRELILQANGGHAGEAQSSASIPQDLAHPYWNSAARRHCAATPASWLFTRLMMYCFDWSFQQPEFSGGLTAAFYAVTSRLDEHTAGCSAIPGHQAPGSRNMALNKELRAMLEPGLFGNLQSALTSQLGEFYDSGGVVHHEIELTKFPEVSNFCFVLGGQRETPMSTVEDIVATQPSPLDGGLVFLLPPGQRFGQGLTSDLDLVSKLLSEQGAMAKVVVNFHTREFLAVRDGDGVWSDVSFQGWQPRKRQWVFESPLIRNSELIEPEWRLSDMDGLLDGNAFWKAPRP